MHNQQQVSSTIPSFIRPNAIVWFSILESEKSMIPSSFCLVTILSLDENKNTIDCKNAETNTIYQKQSPSLFFPINKISEVGYNDMVDMENLNEAELLHNIELRYKNNKIFTYVGPTLLVVNPYHAINSLVNNENMENYKKKVYEANFSLKDVDPHVWGIGALCIKNLVETKKSQAIVISGESGAGKTENTKLAMKFITSVGKTSLNPFLAPPEGSRPLFNARKSKVLVIKDEIPDLQSLENSMEVDKANSIHKKSALLSHRISMTASQKLGKFKEDQNIIVVYEGIEDKILGCSPILEAFGNARTVRNDNSSRFGKLVLMMLEKETKKIKGAMMTNYLLEKSRVINQSQGERNYHVFYHLLKGADAEFLKKLSLKQPKNYKYLNQSGCYDVPTINDENCYQEMKRSFEIMKFHENEVSSIWNIVAAILHLGNLEFDESSLDTQNNIPCKFKNEEALKTATDLLSIDLDTFQNCLTYKTRVIAGKIYKTVVNKIDCQTIKDSFAKSLYERVFIFLIQRLNFSISSPEFRNINIEILLQDKNRFSIDLLDIFGFEVFTKNSFEQFCINFANEKLQQLYIAYVFKSEIEQFILEGLKDHLCELQFKDNQGIIELLESKPIGIFNLLDESSSVASTDDSLLNNIKKQHKNNEFLRIPKNSQDSFTIVHTAKDVDYCVTGFRIKNKDELSNELEQMMNDSKTRTIYYIFQGLNIFQENFGEVSSEDEKDDRRSSVISTASGSYSSKFLGGKFRKQMKDLMDELNSCQCHFIRCIKPNEEKKKQLFVSSLALSQIRYLGVLESIRIRKQSYPIRRGYELFFETYGDLDDDLSKTSFFEYRIKKANFQELSQQLIKKQVKDFGASNILFGKTKVFLKTESIVHMDKLLNEKLKFKNSMALKIQKFYFKKRQLRSLRKIFKCIKTIQILFRVRKEYKKFKNIKKMVRRIQKWLKNKNLKKNIVKLLAETQKKKKLATKIAALFRQKKERERFFEIKAAGLKISKLIRGHFGRRYFYKQKLAFSLVNECFEKAWKKVNFEKETFAALNIQKIAKGFITRKKNKNLREKIQKKMILFRRNKAAIQIQRIQRGIKVRSMIRRTNWAAFKIQGYFKMKKIHEYYNSLKKATVKIQKVVHTWLLNRHIRKQLWVEFGETQIENYEKVKNLESEALFPNKSKISENNVNHRKNHSKNVDDFLKVNHKSPNLKQKKKDMNEEEFEHYIDKNYSNDVSLGNSNTLGGSNKNSPSHETDFDDLNNDEYEEILSYHSNKTKKNPNEKFFIYNSHKNLLEEQEILIGRKIRLIPLIIDIDLIGDISDIYQPCWSKIFLNLKEFSEKNDNFIKIVEVGETFSLAATDDGNIYSWGENDFFQLGRELELERKSEEKIGLVKIPKEFKQIQKIIAGDNHSFIINYDQNVLVWGDNSKGQLGVGNNKIIMTPKLNNFLPKNQVVDIKSKGDLNVCLLQNGKVLFWPFQKNNGCYIYKPVELPLPLNLKIAMVSCGFNFAMLLSANGLLYSFGKSNSSGQLGHGDKNCRNLPTLIEKLKSIGEKIKFVSCGFKHVICKTGLSKIYCWGDNTHGQLGTGTFENDLSPKVMDLERLDSLKIKVTQAQAGFRSSMILADNGKIFWFGSNGTIENINYPEEIDYKSKLKILNEEESLCKEFIPIKILSSWNKTLGISYLIIADTSKIADPKQQLLKTKVCWTLSSKWDQTTLDPPFIESVSKHFTFNNLAKTVLREGFLKKSKTSPDDQIEKLKLTREEKERLLSFFTLLDRNSPKNNSNTLLRAKSPLRMEKIIEEKKLK